MASTTWRSGSGLWTDPAHWSAGVPTAGAAAVIATGGGVVRITGTARAGSIAAGAAATLSVTGSLTVDLGMALTGAALLAQAAHITDGGLTATNARIALQGGVLAEADAALLGRADVTLSAGAIWSVSTLIAGQENPAPGPYAPGYAALSLDGGATLSASGGVFLGEDAGPGGQGRFPGGTATLRLQGTSVVQAAALWLANAATISLDGTSRIGVGGTGGAAGTVAIGAAGLVAADVAGIGADVALQGTLSVRRFQSGAVDAGGSLTIAGAISGGGTVTLAAGSTLAVGTATGFSGAVRLDDQAMLVLGQADAPAAQLSFTGGSATVDLRGLAWTGQAAAYAPATGRITVGGLTLQAPANLNNATFTTRSDGQGGTLVQEVACFLAGTHLRTPHGDRPVETLRPGDIVVTAAGRLVPIRWVGCTRIDATRHPRPHRVAPVRVRAHAFGRGKPVRDLLLSPDHAVGVAGGLAPVALLSNGATILRDDALTDLAYWHVELERHDLLLAENLPAEAYLDTGNRGLFTHEAGVRPLHPDLSPPADTDTLRAWTERGCRPLLHGGPKLDAVRQRLLRRAAQLGWHMSREPGLVVLAGGFVLSPRLAEDGTGSVLIPADVTSVVLRSRSFVPAESVAGATDPRRLGVAVHSLRLDGTGLRVAPDADGWRMPEPGWRWTDGAASVALPPCPVPRRLWLRIAPQGAWWHLPPGPARTPRRARTPGGSVTVR